MSFRMKTAMILVLACVACTAWAPAVSAELKIGYIRPEYVFRKYEPYKNAQTELQKYEKEQMDELKAMGDKYQANLQDAEKKALLMSEEILQKKREEIQKEREQLDKFYEDLYGEGGNLAKKQAELLQPIIDNINQILMRIGKDEGYDFIFDAEGPVLYADEKYDISDYLLEELAKE